MKKTVITFLALLVVASAIFIQLQFKPINFNRRSAADLHPGFTPLTTFVKTNGAGDLVEAPIYTRENKRVFRLENLDMLFDEDLNMIVTEEKVDELNVPAAVIYKEEDDEFVNGANRSLAIYLDSALDRAYLRDGGKFTMAINLTNEVFTVNLNTSNGPMIIYAFRQRVVLPWWASTLNPTNWGREVYEYYDMHGKQIDRQYLGELRHASWWRTTLFWLTFPLTAYPTLFSNGFLFRVIEATSIGTLGELYSVLTNATWHPWPTIKNEAGEDIITMDGELIRVNPHTKQLVTNLNWPIFNARSGLPIVFWNDDIVTTDFRQQDVEGVVLTNAMTVQSLLETGTDFYMNTITTAFGKFSVPTFLTESNNQWNLMNGESAKGVIDDGAIATDVPGDESSLKDFINNLFSDAGKAFGGIFGGATKVVTTIITIVLWVLIGGLALIIIILFYRKAVSPVLNNKTKGRNRK